MTRWRAVLALGAFLIFSAVSLGNALHKGLISGTSPLIVGTHGFNVAREYSLYTVAGLLLVATLATRQLLHGEGYGR